MCESTIVISVMSKCHDINCNFHVCHHYSWRSDAVCSWKDLESLKYKWMKAETLFFLNRSVWLQSVKATNIPLWSQVVVWLKSIKRYVILSVLCTLTKFWRYNKVNHTIISVITVQDHFNQFRSYNKIGAKRVLLALINKIDTCLAPHIMISWSAELNVS